VEGVEEAGVPEMEEDLEVAEAEAEEAGVEAEL
jgi:hypothetical protein